MLNRLHAALHRPEAGWDPVPERHLTEYGQLQWSSNLAEGDVDRVEQLAGGLAGKSVLDLGGGPGCHSVAFARRGAAVTWHDISRGYLKMARAQAEARGLNINFSLGYLEEAEKFCSDPFDVVFCSVCWYYAMADRQFAELIYRLIRPGGIAWIRTPTAETDVEAGALRRLRYLIYTTLGVKIGHLLPPHGKLEALFNRFPVSRLIADYGARECDDILIVKAPVDGTGAA